MHNSTYLVTDAFLVYLLRQMPITEPYAAVPVLMFSF